MITKKEIKHITLDKDTTAAAIAGKLGITPQNYNNLVSKGGRLNQQDLTRIAAALGVRYMSAFVDENGNVLVGGVSETLGEESDGE